VVVLSRDHYVAMQGNLLTVHLMGAEVHIVDTEDHWELEADALALCDRLRDEGRRPHYIPISGTTALSCLGYVAGALELARQFEDQGVGPDVVYLPFGTGGVFTGMFLTFRALGNKAPFVGISVNKTGAECQQFMDTWWLGISELLEVDADADRGDYTITNQFVGREYGDPTRAGLEAIAVMVETEGILLDSVYSGKVLSGLLHDVASGTIEPGSTVVMLHSGGTPALFAYHEAIAAFLETR